MVTKEQALTADTFHEEGCKRIKGPRGGVTEVVRSWRRSGQTKTWKTRPDQFEVPVKYGLYGTGRITDINAHTMHAAADCPLLKDEGHVD